MIGTQTTGRLPGVTISAVAHEDLTVLVDGEPAQLAVIDAEGKIVASGPAVAREARAVAVNCYRGFLEGTGRLRVHSKPINKNAP